MSKEKLMRKIQELAFAKTETELYLDCHPDNSAALDYYHKTVEALQSLTREYEDRFGPISAEGSSGEVWSWVLGAWPWYSDFEATEAE